MPLRRLLALALFGFSLCSPALPPAWAQRKHKVENVSSYDAQTPEEERKGFHLPEGFDIELVAAEPEIHKPLNIAFDAKGRLWVTDTLEYPYAAPEGKHPRDTVKILSDFRPDGRAGSITTFADGLNIPIGVLPLPSADAALVHSIPDVYKLTDTDGDGRADRREPYYRSIGYKDTHGMTNSFTWGFDGWIYACHGFANDSRLQGSDQATIALQSGNTYRMRPDGSHVEFFTHGQVNPFGLAFDPLGNLYSSDCHSRPLYLLLRGAWYPSFGKPDDGLGFAPEMVSHDHGSTAIAGAVYYAADHFPEAFRDTVFVGNVVTNRLNHDRLEWHGSSPRGIEQPDFLTSDDNWFRPVDIELGPDGALYIADFYNRIIGHYEVPLTHPGRDRERGRIWRVVYRGKDGERKAAAPRADWTKASPDELIEDLGHPNLAVRIQAETQLASLPPDRLDTSALEPVVREGSVHQKVHGLWVLQRLGKLDEPSLERAAHDQDRQVRVHTMRVLAERTAWSGRLRELAVVGLKDDDPFVRRTAAEALGLHPDEQNIRPLLDLRQSASAEDSHLIHVVRMALRDQLRPASAWTFLDGVKLSDADIRDLADVALGVPSAESAHHLLRYLRDGQEPRERLVSMIRHIARFGATEDGPPLLALVKQKPSGEPSLLAGCLKAIQQGTQERGGTLPEGARDLALEVTQRLLTSKQGNDVPLGISLASSFGLREARQELEAVVLNRGTVDNQRTEALAAIAAIDPKSSIPFIGNILGTPDAPQPLRERAALALAGLNQPESQAALLAVLPIAPAPIQTAIATGLATRKEGALALLDAIQAGKASARLLQDPRVSASIKNAGVPDLSERLATLLHGLPPADQRLRDLIKKRRAGFQSAKADAALGSCVFTKTCAVCHQIGAKGARIGPQLDGIGVRGLDRLLEDVLDPNQNVDQTFRVSTLALTDGRIVTGLLLSEQGEVLVLADGQGKEVRVPKTDVEERTIDQLSLMPANIAEQLPEKDFYNLLSYLLAQKASETTGGTPSPAKSGP